MKNYLRILIAATVILPAGIGFAAPHKIRVNDPATARSLIAKGARVIGDYGAFTALEAEDALLAGINTNRLETRDGWNLIRLNAKLMDTRAPEIKALRQPRGAFVGKRLHLVQFAGPVQPEWLAALQQSGAQIVGYIPENTYLIYGDSPALARMQAWAGASDSVQWEGEYTHDLKIHPKVRAVASSSGVYAFSIQLVADSTANTATLALIDRLKSAPVRSDYQLGNYRNLVVSLPANQVDVIAAEPDVVSIHPYVEPKKCDERQDQIIAGNLSGSAPSGPGYLSWLAGKGFTQAQFVTSGFIVDFADGGIDNGTTTPGHFGFYAYGDPSQFSRIAYNRFEGTPNVKDGATLAGCDGHGTLNAHIVANYDAYTGFQHQDSEGYSYGVGVCPFVKVGSSVIFDNSIQGSDYTSPNFKTMLNDAYTSGARIVNNSWGTPGSDGEYDSQAQTYDALVRDAQQKASGNQEMVVVFAAGNDGPCTGNASLEIETPGSAKNVITVGASENVRSLSPANGGNDPAGNDGCDVDDTYADDANGVACFSSEGPCADGRMKPDLVAPGVHITGGVPQNFPPPLPSGNGSAISCFDGYGVCGLTTNDVEGNTNLFFPLGQQFYTESTGTSHSTPAVTGAAALIRQFFINNNSTVPSPAMTKAFLLNSARYMDGPNAGDTLWSPSQGMGELNLGMAFDGAQRYLRDQLQPDVFTGTGQTRVFTGQVVDSSKPFRVTIAWTDSPGSTAGAAYNNDLDLTVSVGGNTYKGNVFSGQYSTTGGFADTMNNVESVFLPAGVSGDFTVTVTAANINSVGVPNQGQSLNQDFALVIYNASATNVPVFMPMAASYSGLFYESAGPELGRSGAITLKTSASSRYTGKLQVGASSYSFNGIFNASGQTVTVITRKNAVSFQLTLSVDVNDPDILTGTVSDLVSFTANVFANRSVFNSRTNPAPFAGFYTLVFPGTNGNAQLPAGDGYGTVSVSTSGAIKLAGALADGTKLSQSATASTGGQWPLYASLYSGQGQLLGWMLFSNSAPSLSGNLDWIKAPIATAKLYPGGFNFGTPALGSKYNPAAIPLISFAEGMITFTAGNLAASITNNVSVSGATVVNLSSNKLSLKLSASKGTFSGSVVPATGKPVSFNGVYLPEQNSGAGCFLGTNQSGAVFFGPVD